MWLILANYLIWEEKFTYTVLFCGYNEKKRIWDDDKLYTQLFVDQLSAEHIIFVYSLSKAIDEYKNGLREKKDQRTDTEDKYLEFLLRRWSKMLLIATISECIEDVVNRKIIDKWQMQFKENNDFDALIAMQCHLVKKWNKCL